MNFSTTDFGSYARELTSLFMRKGIELWVDKGELRYRAPIGSITDTQILVLKKYKSDFISHLSNAASETTTAPSLSPLSFQQEFVWSFLQDAGPFFNTASAIHLQGVLNFDALTRSIQELVRLHQALRTRIVEIDGNVLQQVDSYASANLIISDISASDSIYSTAQQTITTFWTQPLDLNSGPLFKSMLVKLSNDEHILVFVIHHMVIDLVSIGVIYRDLLKLYYAQCHGYESLASSSFRYADYALEQRSTHFLWLAVHLEYWKEKLAKAKRITFPRDFDSRNVLPNLGKIGFSFDDSLSESLYSFSHSRKLSFGLVLLAIYSVLVFRWCKQTDFVVPFSVLGRDEPEYSDVVGLFAFPLLLRINVTGDDSFSDLLSTVATEFNACYEHRDFGISVIENSTLLKGALLQWTSPDDSRPGTGNEYGALGSLAAKQFPLKREYSKNEQMPSDIALMCFGTGSNIAGDLIYKANMFSSTSMHRFIDDFLLVSRHLISTPDRPLSDMSRNE